MSASSPYRWGQSAGFAWEGFETLRYGGRAKLVDLDGSSEEFAETGAASFPGHGDKGKCWGKKRFVREGRRCLKERALTHAICKGIPKT